MSRKRRRWPVALAFLIIGAIGITAYVRAHPLVFMKTHQHCIKCAGMILHSYAEEHEGVFPSHPKGYGNALLLLDEDVLYCVNGPGYDTDVLVAAKRNGTDLPESAFGRVYIQGLNPSKLKSGSSAVVVLFDKLPTPGGDHCHLPGRMWASLAREVLYADGQRMVVAESEWPEFSIRQIELLVLEGFDRTEAERLYAGK